MSAFDELAAADVALLTGDDATVPRRILEEAVRIADRYEGALKRIANPAILSAHDLRDIARAALGTE